VVTAAVSPTAPAPAAAAGVLASGRVVALGGVVISLMMGQVTGTNDEVAVSLFRVAVADSVLNIMDTFVHGGVRGHTGIRRRRALAILDGVFPAGSMRNGLVRFPAVAHDVHADSADLLEVADYDGVFMQMYDIDDATWEAALETAGYKLKSAVSAAAMAAGGGTVVRSGSSNPVILDLPGERDQDRQFLSTPRDIAERDLEKADNQTFVLGLSPGTGPDVYFEALTQGSLSVRYMLLLGVRGGGALSDKGRECAGILRDLRRDARQRARSFLGDMHVPPTRHEHIINACVSMKRGANQSLWLVDDGHEVLGTSVGTGQANLRARGSKGDLKEQLSSLLHLVGLLQPDLYTHHFAELFLEQVDECFRLSPLSWDELVETFYDKVWGGIVEAMADLSLTAFEDTSRDTELPYALDFLGTRTSPLSADIPRDAIPYIESVRGRFSSLKEGSRNAGLPFRGIRVVDGGKKANPSGKDRGGGGGGQAPAAKGAKEPCPRCEQRKRQKSAEDKKRLDEKRRAKKLKTDKGGDSDSEQAPTGAGKGAGKGAIIKTEGKANLAALTSIVKEDAMKLGKALRAAPFGRSRGCAGVCQYDLRAFAFPKHFLPCTKGVECDHLHLKEATEAGDAWRPDVTNADKGKFGACFGAVLRLKTEGKLPLLE
jgi:hypothetical protein